MLVGLEGVEQGALVLVAAGQVVGLERQAAVQELAFGGAEPLAVELEAAAAQGRTAALAQAGLSASLP